MEMPAECEDRTRWIKSGRPRSRHACLLFQSGLSQAASAPSNDGKVDHPSRYSEPVPLISADRAASRSSCPVGAITVFDNHLSMLQDSALPMQAQPKPSTKMARSTKQLPPIVGRRSVPSKSSTDRNLRQSILCATAIVFAYTISVAAAGPSITAFSSGSVQAINRRSAGFIQSVDDTPDFSLLAKGPSALSDPVIVSQLSKFASFLSTSEIEDVEALDEEFEGDEKPTKAHTKKGAIETFKHGQDRLPSAKYSKFKSLLASFRGEENDEETISVTSHSRNSKFRSSKNKLAEDRDEWAVDASTGVSSAGSSDRDAVESGELIIAHSPGTVPKVPTELPFEDEGDVFDPAKPAKRKGAGKKKKNKKAKGLKSVRRR